jgi:hypothetical protein
MTEKFRLLERFLLQAGDTFTATDTSDNLFNNIKFRKVKIHTFGMEISRSMLGESDM